MLAGGEIFSTLVQVQELRFILGLMLGFMLRYIEFGFRLGLGLGLGLGTSWTGTSVFEFLGPERAWKKFRPPAKVTDAPNVEKAQTI